MPPPETAAPAEGAPTDAAAPAGQTPPADAASKSAGDTPSADTAPKPAEIRWLTDEGKAADLSKMNKLLSSLSRLSCESYMDGKSPADFTAPICRIVVKGKKDYTLTIYAKTDKEAKAYPASSSESANVFTLPDHLADPLIADPETLFGNTARPASQN